jgi:hypothetical protein
MADITVAIDEQAADQFFDSAVGLIPAQSSSGSGSLGPFLVSYSASASLAPGDIDLIAPGTIRITDFQVNWNVSLSFGLDLSTILPDFCIPQVCVDIPCVGKVCTPEICVDWPTITVPVSFGDFIKATADLGISIMVSGGVWKVEAVVQSVPTLQFGLVTAALLAAISAALTVVLLLVPFIGPFLAIAVNAIIAAIGIAGVTGLLGLIITPFVSGLRIPIYDQSQTFEALPAGGPVDPAVFITLDAVSAFITSDIEDELVLEVEIS